MNKDRGEAEHAADHLRFAIGWPDDAHRRVIEVIERAIAAAREEGRAAGYAEAIEKAAKVADTTVAENTWSPSPDSTRTNDSGVSAMGIARRIRALAPAATTEEPK